MNIKKQEKEIDATRKFFLRSEIKGFASGNPEVLKSSVSKKEAVTTYKFSAKDKASLSLGRRTMSFAFSCRNQCGKRMVGIIGMGHYMFFNPCVSFGIVVSSWMKCLSVGNFLCPLSSCYSL